VSVNVGIIKAKGMAALFQEGVWVVFMLRVDAISSPYKTSTLINQRYRHCYVYGLTISSTESFARDIIFGTLVDMSFGPG
jgi:hypothetical protein